MDRRNVSGSKVFQKIHKTKLYEANMFKPVSYLQFDIASNKKPANSVTGQVTPRQHHCGNLRKNTLPPQKKRIPDNIQSAMTQDQFTSLSASMNLKEEYRSRSHTNHKSKALAGFTKIVDDVHKKIDEMRSSETLNRNKSNLEKLMGQLKEEIQEISQNLKTNETKMDGFFKSAYVQFPSSTPVNEKRNAMNTSSSFLVNNSFNVSNQTSCNEYIKIIRDLHNKINDLQSEVDFLKAKWADVNLFTGHLKQYNGQNDSSNDFLTKSSSFLFGGSSPKKVKNFISRSQLKVDYDKSDLQPQGSSEKKNSRYFINNKSEEIIKMLKERNLSLEQMVINLEKQLDSSNNIIPELIEKTRNYKKLYEGTREEINHVMNVNTELKAKLGCYEKELTESINENFKSKLNEYENNLKNLEIALKDKNNALITKDKQLKDSLSELEKLSKLKEDTQLKLKNEIENRNQEIQTLRIQVEELTKAQNETSSRDMKKLKEKINLKAIEATNLKQALSNKEKENISLKCTMSDLKARLDDAMKDNNERSSQYLQEVNHLKSQLAQTEDKLSRAMNELLETHQAKLNEVETHSARLTEQLTKEITDLKHSKENFENQMEKLTNENKSINKELLTAKDSLHQAIKEKNQIFNDYSNAKQSIESLSSQNQQLVDYENNLVKENKQLKSELQNKTNENNNMNKIFENAIKDLKSKLQETEKARSEHEKTACNITKLYQESQMQNQLSEQTIDDLSSTLKTLKMEKAILEEKINDNSNTILQYKNDIQAKSIYIDKQKITHEKEINEIKSALTEKYERDKTLLVEKQKDTQEKKLHELRATLAEQEHKSELLTQTNQSLLKELQEKMLTYTHHTEELSIQILNLHAEKKILEETLVRARDELSNREKAIDDLQEYVNQISNDNKILQENLDEVERTKEEIVENIQNSDDSARKQKIEAIEFQELKRQLTKKEDEIDNLYSTIERCKVNLLQMQSALQEQETTNTQLIKSQDDALQDKQMMMNEIAQLKNKVDTKDNEISSLKLRKSELIEERKLDLAHKNEMDKDYLSKISKLEEKIEQMTKENARDNIEERDKLLQIKDLELKIHNLKETLHSNSQEAIQCISQKDEEIRALSGINSQLSRDLIAVRDNFESFKVNSQKREEDYLEQQNSLKIQMQEKESLAHQIENETLKEELFKKTEDILNMKETTLHLQMKLDDCQKLLEQNTNESQRYKQDFSSLSLKFLAKVDEIKALSAVISAKEEENNKLRVRIAEHEREMREMSDECEDIKVINGKLINTIEELKQKNEDYCEENEELEIDEDQVKSLKIQVENLKELVREKENDITQLHQKLGSYQVETEGDHLSKLNNTSNIGGEDIKKDPMKLLEKCNRYQNKLGEYKQENLLLNQQLLLLKDDIKSYIAEVNKFSQFKQMVSSLLENYKPKKREQEETLMKIYESLNEGNDVNSNQVSSYSSKEKKKGIFGGLFSKKK